jgi:hypothetical protein
MAQRTEHRSSATLGAATGGPVDRRCVVGCPVLRPGLLARREADDGAFYRRDLPIPRVAGVWTSPWLRGWDREGHLLGSSLWTGSTPAILQLNPRRVRDKWAHKGICNATIWMTDALVNEK